MWDHHDLDIGICVVTVFDPSPRLSRHGTVDVKPEIVGPGQQCLAEDRPFS